MTHPSLTISQVTLAMNEYNFWVKGCQREHVLAAIHSRSIPIVNGRVPGDPTTQASIYFGLIEIRGVTPCKCLTPEHHDCAQVVPDWPNDPVKALPA